MGYVYDRDNMFVPKIQNIVAFQTSSPDPYTHASNYSWTKAQLTIIPSNTEINQGLWPSIICQKTTFPKLLMRFRVHNHHENETETTMFMCTESGLLLLFRW